MNRRSDVPTFGQMLAYGFLALLGLVVWSLIAVSSVVVLATR